jgi:para-aminobenzoate synthetase component 1
VNDLAFRPRPPDPLRLLPSLPAESGIRLLAGRGEGGWRSDPLEHGRSASPGVQLLALDPERQFRGGRSALRAALDWLAPAPSNEPWDRVLIGSLSYELGAELAGAPAQRPEQVAPVDLAGFRAVYVHEPGSRSGRIEGSCSAARERLARRIETACASARPAAEPVALARPSSSLDREAFRRGVEQIREWIRRGDVYQVNLTRALAFPEAPHTRLRSMFMHLSNSGDAPFAAYLESPERVVISNSPERFLRVRDGRVETCPIKGTAARGQTAEEDRVRADALLRSGKDAAEHVMIVDLERNDLGRVCETGSVRVAELAALRSYASVHHLVSSVQGRLRADVDALALLEATFPSGSVTGAPKLRAMQIIAELEPVARDVYTGAIGYFDARGGVDLSVAIRTAVQRNGSLYLHAGGGIVSESDARAEWCETETKLAAFAQRWGFAP